MDYTEEEQLVIDAQKADRLAFSELVRRYRTAAYAAAYRHLRNHDEAEDITQEALLTAYENIAKLRQPSRFSAWLCAISARKAMKRIAKKDKSPEVSEARAEEQIISSEYEVWKALDAGEINKVIHGLVTELSRIHREAIELYYFQGYTVSEIARFLDVPSGTVKRRLFDARERLRLIIPEAMGQELFEELKRSMK